MIGQSGTWPSDDPTRNARTALENWVEKGTAPGTLVATKLAGDAHSLGGKPGAQVVMTRLVCPYPQKVKYKGSGDPNKAESFVCAAAGK